MEAKNKVPFSIELELEDGGTVIYDNVVSYLVEEQSDEEIIDDEIEKSIDEEEPSDTESPDEVPEEGEEERDESVEVDEETA